MIITSQDQIAIQSSYCHLIMPVFSPKKKSRFCAFGEVLRSGKVLCYQYIANADFPKKGEEKMKKMRFYRDLNSDRWIQSPEC